MVPWPSNDLENFEMMLLLFCFPHKSRTKVTESSRAHHVISSPVAIALYKLDLDSHREHAAAS